MGVYNMFYSEDYRKEREQAIEMNKKEQFDWIVSRLDKPSLELECDLKEDDHIKFKSVCALRLIQMLNKND